MATHETGGFGGGSAVVLGASMAGLVTARVLTRHFKRVTIVERDRAPRSPEARKGVPQERHIHLLLGAGLNTIADLFPGIVEDIIADGAHLADFGEDIAWYHYGVWKARFASGIPMVQCSRALLDHHIRRRVRALPNVEIMDETAASGLSVSADGLRVAGVRVERSGRGPAELPAELVVDASGRGSRAPRWLEAAGCPIPSETTVGIDLAYVSRFYRCPERDRGKQLFVILYARAPEQKRGGLLYAIEGDRWWVSLNGYFGEHPPLDDAGFLAFSRTLPRADIHELIKDAEPLSDPVIHKFPASRRRHFEALPRHLEGFVVLGDAACSFNPTFGQGMSAACLGAKVLDQRLREQPRGDLRGLSARFQRALAAMTDLPWRLATTEDFRYPETTGERPFGIRALNWYKAQLLEMSSHDTRIYGRFLLVLHLVRRLNTLFAPSVVLAVLGYALRGLFVPLRSRASTLGEPLRKEDAATRALLRSHFPGLFASGTGASRMSIQVR